MTACSDPKSETWAHVRKDEASGQWDAQTLVEHLAGTAELAGVFADIFGNGDWARLASLWHDLGKFNPAWQDYLKGKSGYDMEVNRES